MSMDFDIACLRAPVDQCDVIGIAQLIERAKMAADQIEALANQRDELLAALKEISSSCGTNGNSVACSDGFRCPACRIVQRIEAAR